MVYVKNRIACETRYPNVSAASLVQGRAKISTQPTKVSMTEQCANQELSSYLQILLLQWSLKNNIKALGLCLPLPLCCTISMPLNWAVFPLSADSGLHQNEELVTLHWAFTAIGFCQSCCGCSWAGWGGPRCKKRSASPLKPSALRSS